MKENDEVLIVDAGVDGFMEYFFSGKTVFIGFACMEEKQEKIISSKDAMKSKTALVIGSSC